MTISELAMNWIENADTTPDIIDLDTATQYISWMDPDSDLPEDLTPETFMEAWNEIIRSGNTEDDAIRTFAQYMYDHADETPTQMITVGRAREILDMLDPSVELPEGMSPGAFAEAYNNIIRLAFSE